MSADFTFDKADKLYTPNGDIPLVNVARDNDEGTMTGHYLTEDKILVPVTGYYVFSSLAYGPHWMIEVEDGWIDRQFQIGKFQSWEEYKDFTDKLPF